MTIQKREIQLPNVQNKLAFVLDGVLSEEECKALIDEAEEKGFEQALLNIGVGETLATDFRSSQRCIIDSFEKADFIWSRKVLQQNVFFLNSCYEMKTYLIQFTQ